jgi:hypothetical protein
MRAAIICTNESWVDTRSPIRAVAAGLKHLGCDVAPTAIGDWPIFATFPDVAFIWNGVHGRRGLIADKIRKCGVPVLVMERGFLDRFNHTQIDHAGFNHTASWAVDLAGPAPVGGVARFARLIETIGPPRPVKPRSSGHILILGQVPGDAQLRDSEISHAEDLVRAVEKAAGPGVELRFRPHPLGKWRTRRGDWTTTLDGELADAVDAARFAITINSNSANDVLLRGCPVLCLGPALQAIAGVAIQTSLAGLQRNIELMLDGWKPDSRRVLSYLHWLAARQWTIDELAGAGGGVLARLLSAAGLKLE